jgi:hypothetical protein
MKELVAAQNELTQLYLTVAAPKLKGATIGYFDSHALFTDMINNPAQVRPSRFLCFATPVAEGRRRPAVPERHGAAERDRRGRVLRVQGQPELRPRGLHVPVRRGEGLVPLGGRAPPIRAGGPPPRADALLHPHREEQEVHHVPVMLSTRHSDAHAFLHVDRKASMVARRTSRKDFRDSHQAHKRLFANLLVRGC